MAPFDLLALDPGPHLTGMSLHTVPRQPCRFQVLETAEVIEKMIKSEDRVYKHIAVEMYHGYGAPIDENARLTILAIGRIIQIGIQTNKCPVTLMYRKEVARHLCYSMHAGDPEINAVLRDIYGNPGTKKDPGVIYGIKSHAWAALAVATTWEDLYPTGALGYMTLLPDGTWEDQATRDKIAAEKKQQQAAKAKLTKAKRAADKTIEVMTFEQCELDWQTRAGA